ncbi:long-chain-fatty-acid--CoA ligase [Heyndrickxia faecalis]|uniref:Long-chain-fatty-acid--CoA ligase n=1 Tax=Heyndrickxia faecalis TaxID=2824910 RepID=A0AAU7WCW7_9BACI
MFVGQQLKWHAIHQPDHIITSYRGKKMTYAQFYREAINVAGFFQKKGYKKGDIIALFLHNSDVLLIAYYACQLGGFTAMPVNTKLAPPEVQYIFHHSEAKALIYDTRLLHILHEIPREFHQFQDRLMVGGEDTFRAIAGENTDAFMPPQIEADDTAVIFYTSGTTGRPKGVMLSAANVRAAAQIWAEAMDLSREDRVHIVTPLFHCAACHVFSIPAIYRGGTMIIEEQFSPEKTLETMEKEKVTVFFGVPAMYSILLNAPKMAEVDLSYLRLFCYGASPMPYERVRQLKTRFPTVKVQNLYGQTENAPAASTLTDRFAMEKAGSVGQALPQTEIQVVDAGGSPVPAGEVGEIIVKGPQVMKGYLKNEEETRRVLQNGWLYSGDLGYFDEAGFLYLVDRKKDMLIRGGENVYPVEVEEVLYEMPEILEAAVVGIPHEIYGEVPKAYIVVKKGETLTEEKVFAYCSGKLAKYKWPAEIEFLQTLPRNASGKVLKHVLRKQISGV